MLKRTLACAALLALAAAVPARAQDVVRLGNLKFAHYGAISYMKEIAPKFGLKIDERQFAKGADIYPAMAVDQIDIAASGGDGAVAARGNGVKLLVVAGFANGGVRILKRPDLPAKTAADLKGLYSQLMANVKGQDPSSAFLIGGLGAYDAGAVNDVYDASFGQNTGYTADCLNAKFAGGISGVQGVVNTLVTLRKTTGSWVFMQQLGVRSSTDPDDSLKAQAFQYAASKKVGWAYWERRDSTDPTDYGAYYQDGSNWVQKPGVYAAVTAGFLL